MTREECEKIMGDCLKIIRDACYAYLPDYPKDEVICSMYISGQFDSAVVMTPVKGREEGQDGEYLLNYSLYYGGEEEDEADDNC